ncbi:hypothetical protein [Candidatus Nitrospira bockiana]
MSHHPDRSFSHLLKSEPRRAFYDRNKPIAVLMILIVFLSPIIGVLLSGLPGAVFGVAASVAGYYLAPYAVLTVAGLGKD